MTDQTEPEPVLYDEPGSSWWPLLWGPVFAAIGAGVEALTGPLHAVAWLLVGLGLVVVTFAWVSARRKVLAVRLTPHALQQGREELPVERIAEVEDVGASMGAKVLGGGWVVPKRFTGLPLQLTDGTRVIAWAKRPDDLRAALARRIDPDRLSADDHTRADEHS
jgi:hypothetical protein